MTSLARRSPPLHAQGFTLIELLASLLAGSLLLLWLGWAVAGISEQWTRGAVPNPVRELAHNRLQIVNLIQSALYPLASDNLPSPTASQLTFAIVPPRSVDGPTVVRLTLAVEQETGATQRLVASLQDLKSGRQLTPVSILASGWKAIAIKTEMPAADDVRPLVEIGFTATNGETFAILARPQVDAEPGCEFDPISMECRP